MYHCSSVKESKFFNKNEKWVELMNGLLNAIRYQLFFENGIIGNIGILENWFRVLYNSNIPGGEITQFI
jgi:hypothetical protein